ncbi:hypothetical protein GCM10009798_02430 [Nocardioides panacihumi]|uniref:Uncharacterized protein n=1 Tax=Nocardioides panacihumi TaxID=400774 RepID=A0ABP5BKA4_9ACTN
MTQQNPGKHLAVRRRAIKRPPLTRAVPLGALLVATTGAVAAVALPGDSDAPATRSTTSARETWTPPAPQVVAHGTRVAPAAFVTPSAGRHRGKPAAASRPDAATTPAATTGTAPRANTGGRHRADVAHASPTGHSAPATHAAPAPTPSGSGSGSASGSGSGSNSGSGSTGGSGSVVDSVVGTVATTVNGLVGGLVPGSTTP